MTEIGKQNLQGCEGDEGILSTLRRGLGLTDVQIFRLVKLKSEIRTRGSSYFINSLVYEELKGTISN